MSAYTSLDLASCIAHRPAMPEQILPGLIRGAVGALFSPGGVGKTTLALQISAYRATGRDFLGFGPCTPGRVVVFAAEDPPAILGMRIHDIAARLADDERRLLVENLRVVPVSCQMLRDLLDGGETARAMREAAEGRDLVVIDIISRFHYGDENAREDAAAVMRRLECIAEAGCAVIFLGHVSKAAAMNGQGDMQQAAKGSAVWVDEARWVAFLSTCSDSEAKEHGIAPDDRRRYVRHGLSKANYTEPRPDIWLRREAGGVLVRHEMPAAVKAKAKTYAAASGGRGDDNDW